MVNSIKRWMRHLLAGRWSLNRAFPQAVLDEIEETVRALESVHPGEIRFAVETALHPAALWRGLSPRDRAIEVFSRLRVWDTEHNNGVLVYVLLADRDVEIVADRAVAGGRVPVAEWQRCCRVMQQYFARERYRDGVVAGLQQVAAVLAQYPPDRPDHGNELPDRPAVL